MTATAQTGTAPSAENRRIVPCPACQAANRMPAAKPFEHAKCGKCGAKLFQGKPLVLNADSLARHAGARDIPLLVDFWAEWCGPCKMMAPAFEAAAQALEPRVRLGKVDTEAHQELAARFNIRSIPTLVIFRGGKEIARVSGAMSAPQLQAWAESQIA